MIERQSQTWRAVDQYCMEEIFRLRLLLEVQGLDPVETEFARGRIAALRELLALGADEPRMASAATLDGNPSGY